METDVKKSYPKYRSNYRARPSHKQGTAQAIDYRETFIVQCIICGVILAVVLTISLFDAPFAKSVSSNIKYVVTEEVDAQSPPELMLAMSSGLNDVKDKVKSLFTVDDGSEQPTNAPASTEVSSQTPAATEDFRIDEDILSEINAKEDFYGEPEKKQQVPLMEM